MRYSLFFAVSGCLFVSDKQACEALDFDGDGFYPPEAADVCVDFTIDCNNRDSDIFPGAVEACGDGVDNDCDQEVDEGCDEADAEPMIEFVSPENGAIFAPDTQITIAVVVTDDQLLPADFVSLEINGEPLEIDQDAETGEAYTTTAALPSSANPYVINAIAVDSAGNLVESILSFSIQGVDLDEDGFATDVDCDDQNPDRFPGAPEICNQLDDDCDLEVDEISECEVWLCDEFGSEISDDLSLEVNSRYMIDCLMSVKGTTFPTLTIPSGTQLIFTDTGSLSVGGIFPGTVQILGDEDNTTLLKSDGDASSGDRWEGIQIFSNGSFIASDIVVLGANNAFDVDGMLQLDSASIQFMADSSTTIYAAENSAVELTSVELYGDPNTILSSSQYGIVASDPAILELHDVFVKWFNVGLTCETTNCITDSSGNNRIYGNFQPVILEEMGAIEALPTALDFARGTSDANVVDGIVLTDSIIEEDITLPTVFELPYHFTEDLLITESAILTLDRVVAEFYPGVSLSFGEDNKGGVLIANEADLHGFAGSYWEGIYVSSNGSIQLTDSIVEDGNEQNIYLAGPTTLTVTIEGNIIRDTFGYGIFCASGCSSYTGISNNTYVNLPLGDTN